MVRTALALIDEIGLEGLTMRSLADRLGVKAASLYWHLHDKEELLDLLGDAILAEVPESPATGPWRAELESLAASYRQVLLAHRDAVRVVAGLGVRPGAQRLNDRILSLLARAGFSEEEAAHATFLLTSYVPGFVAEEAVGPGRRQRREPVATPLAGAASGRLEFRSGAGQVRIYADSSLPDLYRARFEGREPAIRVEGGTVAINQRGRRSGGEVALNASIPWQIELRGGVWKVVADLAGLELESLEVSGGASELTVTLPKPSGAVPVRFHKGVHEVTVRRPTGVAVRVRVGGGASRLGLDDSYFGAIGGEIRWETPDAAGALDRYDIEVRGGAAHLTIESADPEADAEAGSSPGVLHDRSEEDVAKGAGPDMDSRFAFGLEVILDGLEKRLGDPFAERS